MSALVASILAERLATFDAENRVIDSADNSNVGSPDSAIGIELIAPEVLPDSSALVVITHRITPGALSELAQKPNELYSLTPYQFEEVVAQLLSRDGYEVLLTPHSHDGGIDIRAYRRDSLGTFEYLIQCKQYSPGIKVGVRQVRELNGVIMLERSAGGGIVTTSYFTRGAHEEKEKTPHRLSLVDLDMMKAWLRNEPRSTNEAEDSSPDVRSG